MHWEPYTRAVREAVDAAADFLLARQSREGFWLDYDLPPGLAEAWSTAWVGWALAQRRDRAGVDAALARAVRALASCRRPGGWGYNRSTATDADSTAWSLRSLAAIGVNVGPGGVCCLEPHLDPGGGAHTFAEADAGSWGESHPDVTAVVGLALLAVRAPSELVASVRRAVLDARASAGVWTSFWWESNAYATAWSLDFLARTGGVAPRVARDAAAWLADVAEPSNAFETAHRILCALALGSSAEALASPLVDALLDTTQADGSWPSSAVLLVPARTEDGESVAPGAHADGARTMSTAIARAALARWLRVTGQDGPSVRPRSAGTLLLSA